ncbi:hypothetical protein, partial [Mesorhizobium sp. M00.F.Ca.ET.216.01.1.1]|uniref:hypothetical protein n=1 Tax=Mesorhizobium sp. M00.F.Ca.ET.216.01.1.1 TaxID=2500528 RepID=UPI001AEE4BDB
CDGRVSTSQQCQTGDTTLSERSHCFVMNFPVGTTNAVLWAKALPLWIDRKEFPMITPFEHAVAAANTAETRADGSLYPFFLKAVRT